MIQCEHNEDHENPRTPMENNENRDFFWNSYENHANHENPRIPLEIRWNHENHRIHCENNETN